MKISVIVPTYNEESTIEKTLEDLITKHKAEEVIVVDGGSTDNTVTLAKKWTTVLQTEKSRARQMNRGAEAATGDVLLFLHSDTKLPDNGLDLIRNEIGKGAKAGRFRMKFDGKQWLLRLYESYTRFHFFSYGDQGFFVTGKIFNQLGGFNETAPFEDVDFYSRLRKLTKPVILKDCVTTSARRFMQNGLVRQKLINLFLMVLHYAGLNVLNLRTKLYSEVR